jgi:hypothetical protein
MLCSKFLQHKQNHLKYAGLCLLEEVFKRSPPLLSSSQETCLRLCLGNKNQLSILASASWRRYSRGLLCSSHPAKRPASGSV